MTRKRAVEAFKLFLVVLGMVIAIGVAAWFIPAFLHEIQGTFQCKTLGDVSVCWSIK